MCACVGGTHGRMETPMRRRKGTLRGSMMIIQKMRRLRMRKPHGRVCEAAPPNHHHHHHHHHHCQHHTRTQYINDRGLQ